jgi:hypothetical protein
MTYATGSASDPADLLDKVRAFLLSEGWTIDDFRDRTDHSGWKWLIVSKSGFRFQLWEERTSLNGTASLPPWNIGQMIVAGSYNSGANFNAQPGYMDTTHISYVNGIQGPFTAHHFFSGTGASGPYFYCALEVTAGEFRHFGIGCLDKMGSYTGGEFVTSSAWSLGGSSGQTQDPTSGYNQVPFDEVGSSNNGFMGSYGGTFVRCQDAFGTSLLDYSSSALGIFKMDRGIATSGARGRARGGTISNQNSQSQLIYDAGPISPTGVSPVWRIQVAVDRGSGFGSFIGEPPAFRHVAMDYLNAGDELTFGTDVWKVFPCIRKVATGSNGASGRAGVAYLKA